MFGPFTAWLPLMLTCLVIGLAVALPLARLALKHGRWGLVVTGAQDAVARVTSAALVVALGLALAWTGAIGALGPEVMGVWAAPGWTFVAGAAVGVAALVAIVIAQAQMGASWRIGIDRAPTGLVTGGLFRHVRHPIYSGLFALLLALVLLTPSPWTVMGAAWLGSLIAIQARLEERHLAAVHGDAFATWAARTGRFLPAIGRLASASPS